MLTLDLYIALSLPTARYDKAHTAKLLRSATGLAATAADQRATFGRPRVPPSGMTETAAATFGLVEFFDLPQLGTYHWTDH